MKDIKIRAAQISDAAPLLGIYAPYIRDTAITFEYEVPPAEEFAGRIEAVTRSFPWLVCEIDGHAAGYAYTASFRPRAAFQWDAEVSVYLSPEYHRMGIASVLYACMESVVREQGYLNLYALITHPNPVSEGFHTSRGFRPLGIYQRTGYKFGKWHDLIVMEKQLASLPERPEPCKTVHELDSEFLSEQIRAAEAKIRDNIND